MLFFLLFLLTLTSCGIKSKPRPLPEPEFQLKRVGEFVYVIGNKLIVPGFQKGKGFWFVRRKDAFCFKVKRVNGKTRRVCVKEAVNTVPKVRVRKEEDYLKLIPDSSGTFRVYEVEDGIVLPYPVKEFRKEGILERKYFKYRVAVTKLLKKSVESYPTFVEVPPKPKPKPEPPYDAGYFRYNGRVVLYWFHKNFEDLIGFNVYRNGKKLNDKPIKANVYIEKELRGKAIYEVRAVNKFGVESEGVRISVP